MRALITRAEVGTLGRPCYAEDATLDALIAEAEREDIKPRIGDALFVALKTPQTEAGLTDQQRLILNGGSWTDSRGASRLLTGLKTALAYFVYARIVRDGNLQVTRYGVKLKTDDNSANAEDAERQRQYRQAFGSADGYLAEVLAYLNDATETPAGPLKSNRTKFKVLGGAGSTASAVVSRPSGGSSASSIDPARVEALEAKTAGITRAANVTSVDGVAVKARVEALEADAPGVLYYRLDASGNPHETAEYAANNARVYASSKSARVVVYNATDNDEPSLYYAAIVQDIHGDLRPIVYAEDINGGGASGLKIYCEDEGEDVIVETYEKELIPEAPQDSKQYARRNGAWSEVQAGGGSVSWALLRTITLTEAANRVACYDIATDAACDHIRVTFTMPSVTGIQNIRPYINEGYADSYFFNIAKYFANNLYIVDFNREMGLIFPSGYYPYVNGQYASICEASCMVPIKEAELKSINLRLYSGTFPAGTVVKVYKK